jgi:hypothetical protein
MIEDIEHLSMDVEHHKRVTRALYNKLFISKVVKRVG